MEEAKQLLQGFSYAQLYSNHAANLALRLVLKSEYMANSRRKTGFTTR